MSGTAREQFTARRTDSPRTQDADGRTTNQLDYQVPVDQGLRLFTALRLRACRAALGFEDEGHWVLKALNSKLWHGKVFGWMNTYLGK